jgi:hypothetical protein
MLTMLVMRISLLVVVTTIDVVIASYDVIPVHPPIEYRIDVAELVMRPRFRYYPTFFVVELHNLGCAYLATPKHWVVGWVATQVDIVILGHREMVVLLWSVCGIQIPVMHINWLLAGST